MKDPHEVILPSGDATVLRRLLREHLSTSSPASWSEELAALPRHARIVAPAYLPPGRIGIGSPVSYGTEPGGVRRSTTLCHPGDADGANRLSVLDPIGLALLGRKPGSVVMSALPNGWPFSVRVLDVEASEPDLCDEARLA